LFLNEIILNTKIFIDANIFVYHFSAGSIFNKSCTDFLAEVEAKKFQGFTSTAIVQEAIHRLMMVRETMEDVIEDMLALSSESFLFSIDQSRKDYKEGRIKTFEEVFNV